MPHADVQGRRLYYETHGPEPGGKAGTPLVLAMGIGGSCKGWLPFQVPDLSKDRPVLIFDYPGVGGSEPMGAGFTTADLSDTLAALLDALRIPQADLLGAFMGGMVAQELALRHADRVRRLVLVGTYARADAKRRLILEQWRDLARHEVPLELLVRDRLLWTAQDETLAQTDLIEAMFDFFKRDGAPLTAEVFAAQCDAAHAHDTLDRLSNIRHPTLVICGRQDLLTPVALHQQLAEGIPDARQVTVAYGAHLVMVESVETFNRTVQQFLDD